MEKESYTLSMEHEGSLKGELITSEADCKIRITDEKIKRWLEEKKPE
jgi:hypothetical protein